MNESRLKKVAKFSLVTIVFACLIQILFDPFANYRNQKRINELQFELRKARSKWERNKIENYSFEVEQGIPLAGIFCHAKIKVTHGEIIEVAANTYPAFMERPQNEPLIILEPGKWDDTYCRYSELTVSNFFDKAEFFMREQNVISISFDAELGYVTEIYGNSNNNSKGLLTAGLIGDSEFSYTFSNFQRLDSTP